MKVDKVINNNVISAYDAEGKEIVVMGRGIGFKAKSGQLLDYEKVEKIFRMDSREEAERFKSLLANLPLEHIQVSNEIITYAKEKLEKELNKNIYITLTDHISFAIERFKKGMVFQNILIWDVKKFYSKEYEIGKYALELIERKTAIKLPNDEAASIALHLVNAEYNTQMKEIWEITNIVKNAVEDVTDTFQLTTEEDHPEYIRFVSNLKFLAQKLFEETNEEKEPDEFLVQMRQSLEEEYHCAEKIAESIYDNYQKKMSEEEKIYFAIDIRRMRYNN